MVNPQLMVTSHHFLSGTRETEGMMIPSRRAEKPPVPPGQDVHVLEVQRLCEEHSDGAEIRNQDNKAI